MKGQILAVMKKWVTNRGGMIHWRLVTVSLLVVSLMTWPMAIGGTLVLANNATIFSGQATVIKGKVAGIPITLVDTGPVAAEGGELEANLLCYPTGNNCTIGGLPDVTNGILSAQVLHAAVVARGHTSHAEASVAEFSLTNVAGNNISAEFLGAEAEAKCNGGAASISGTAQVAELTINGQTIDVTGEANQKVELPGGGFVVINEQVGSVNGDKGEITVSALHIFIPGVLPGTDTDIFVAQAHADIFCGTVHGCPGDRVTGGGWYYWPASPNRVHFALAARNLTSTWGHLLYMDKAQDLKVKGTPQLAAMTPTPGTKNDGTGTVEGTASANRQVNGQNVGYFVVKFVDGGEPGRNDKFAITLLTKKDGELLYEANVSLAFSLNGGNLQYHDCK